MQAAGQEGGGGGGSADNARIWIANLSSQTVQTSPAT